jgi:hypothetical protein
LHGVVFSSYLFVRRHDFLCSRDTLHVSRETYPLLAIRDQFFSFIFGAAGNGEGWTIPYVSGMSPEKDGQEQPGALLARRTEEGMESDDLLCSRNARPPKALVGRAQWKINQPPSLARIIHDGG